jgi:hypothetical protein
MSIQHLFIVQAMGDIPEMFIENFLLLLSKVTLYSYVVGLPTTGSLYSLSEELLLR